MALSLLVEEVAPIIEINIAAALLSWFLFLPVDFVCVDGRNMKSHRPAGENNPACQALMAPSDPSPTPSPS